jgi:hypothetical protein
MLLDGENKPEANRYDTPKSRVVSDRHTILYSGEQIREEQRVRFCVQANTGYEGAFPGSED